MKLPVIIERNAWTMPQERYNTEWVKEQRAGVVLPDFRGIDKAVARMLTTSDFADYKASVERIENRAVFEIPGILAAILRR